ncbi:OLC1v1036179C1 [Oldenlandia corymbosa var. corymbosa]|uniref:OLC1v1036179C1 n=1 Tax=Oldenlandia corymbosa var. corymbosa TaxID=529605 RepID=A0AAV1CY68_OLDCO|nr:OLC1v1036179C1 [Oldenlandia corymbosa var. corymbosa]
MNMLPNILAVDSYSTVITYQSTGRGRQSSQQQSNVESSLFGERSSYLESYRTPGFQTPAFQSPFFQVPVFSSQGQTRQVPVITPEMLHQRFSEIEHTVATQVEHFENAFQRLTDHNANTGSVGPSRSMTSGVNTATGATSSEVPPVSMVNNPLYHAIFQTSATDTPVQNLGAGLSNNGSHNAALQGILSWYYPVVPSQPTFVSPPGNFTFDGRQLPPLSPQYGTPVMMLGTSWGQQSPYQGFQVCDENHVAIHGDSPSEGNELVLHSSFGMPSLLCRPIKEERMDLDYLCDRELVQESYDQDDENVINFGVQTKGDDELMEISAQEYQGSLTLDVGVLGTAGVTINQGPVGMGNNEGTVGENARQARQHVQTTNDCCFIFYQNRVPRNNTAAANLDDPHIPQGSGVVVVDPQIVLPHQTLEENREEQQWMEYEANQILNQNRAQAIGR